MSRISLLNDDVVLPSSHLVEELQKAAKISEEKAKELFDFIQERF